MANGSTPAFQFYPQRWLAGTAHLSPAARGVYIDLLAWAWDNNRPLPLSLEARCQIGRVLSVTTFEALWSEIADKWTETPQGYQNAALERVRGELTAFRQAQREKGIQSGIARRQKRTRFEPGYEPGSNPDTNPIELSCLLSPKKIKSVSAEPLRDSTPPEPILLEFPVVGKGAPTWPLRTGLMDEWRALYPGVDVLAEVRKALAWCLANPGRRKTAKGMPAFLVNWLNRAVDSGRTASAGASTTTKGSRTADNMRQVLHDYDHAESGSGGGSDGSDPFSHRQTGRIVSGGFSRLPGRRE